MNGKNHSAVCIQGQNMQWKKTGTEWIELANANFGPTQLKKVCIRT